MSLMEWFHSYLWCWSAVTFIHSFVWYMIPKLTLWNNGCMQRYQGGPLPHLSYLKPLRSRQHTNFIFILLQFLPNLLFFFHLFPFVKLFNKFYIMLLPYILLPFSIIRFFNNNSKTIYLYIMYGIHYIYRLIFVKLLLLFIKLIFFTFWKKKL